jgi:hypothetical protein
MRPDHETSIRDLSTPADPFARLSGDHRARLRRAPLPEKVEPMKAVLTQKRFSDPA